MDLREALQSEHSKAQTVRILNYIGSDKDRFDALMAIFFSDTYRLSQRSAWVVGYIAEKNPQLIEPYLEKMLLNLENPVHVAIKRNTIRVLRILESYPEHLEGLIADICFKYLDTPSVPLAIRAFAIRVLFKICQKQPELREEFKMMLENILENDKAPAIQSAGKDVYRRL
jgi:hypothetical protein